jgi:hypothetical protein
MHNYFAYIIWKQTKKVEQTKPTGIYWLKQEKEGHSKLKSNKTNSKTETGWR